MIDLLLLGDAPVHAAAGVAHLAQSSSGSSGCTIAPGGARVSGLCTEKNSLRISVSYVSILPVLIVAGGALVLLVVSAVLPKRAWRQLYCLLTVAIGVCAAGAAGWQWTDVGTKNAQATIGQQIFYDRFSVFFLMLISVSIILGALISDSYLRREGLDGVEPYALMLLAGAGAMLMAESGGLIMLFLALEIMSIALYVLAAYHRRRSQSGEAGFKYFILGAFSSAIFLYGIALAYGSTGSTQFGEIAGFLARNSLPNNGVLLGAIALLIVGLGFKVGAVPFHNWIPDVYQGAPTPFTGYMAAVAKAAGFAGLIRVLNQAFITQQADWRPAIWLIAVLSLLVGSVIAIAQKDLKRMLAYSSVAQAGYVLVGVQAASSAGTAAALFYLFTYAFIIIGAFAVVQLIQGPGEVRNDLGEIRGLARRQPALALAMLVFLLALAGVPFTSGFLAKFYVVSAAIQRGQYPLAIIAMLAAAAAAFFYLRVALLMYSPGPANVDGGEDAPIGDGASAGEPSPIGEPQPIGEPAPASAAVSPVVGPVGGGLEPVAGPVGGGVPASAGLASPVLVATADDGAMLAGLQPIPSLDGKTATAALEAPSPERIKIPLFVGLALTICVAFTIFAGVSSPVITFAREATTLF